MEARERIRTEGKKSKFSDFRLERCEPRDLSKVKKSRRMKGFLSDEARLNLILNKNSKTVKKILITHKNHYQVYEPNPLKTAFIATGRGQFNDPRRQIDWEIGKFLEINDLNSELTIVDSIQTDPFSKPQATSTADNDAKLVFYKTTLRDIGKKEVLDLQFAGEKSWNSSVYYVTQMMRKNNFGFLNNRFINSSQFMMMEYSYDGVRRPGKNKNSYMVEGVRRKVDSARNCTKSVFELFGWDFKSRHLRTKLRVEKLLVEDLELRRKIMFDLNYSSEVLVEFKHIPLKGKSYFYAVMVKKHFLVFSLLDLRSKRIIRTAFVSIYELWASLDQKLTKGFNCAYCQEFKYSFIQGRLYTSFSLLSREDEDIDSEDGDSEGESENNEEDEGSREDLEGGNSEDSQRSRGGGEAPTGPQRETMVEGGVEDPQTIENQQELGNVEKRLQDQTNEETQNETDPLKTAQNNETQIDEKVQKNLLSSSNQKIEENKQAEEEEFDEGPTEGNQNAQSQPNDPESDQTDSEDSEMLHDPNSLAYTFSLLSISSMFNHKQRKLKLEAGRGNHITERYDNTTTALVRETRKKIKIFLTNEKNNSTKKFEIDKKSNNLNTRLPFFQNVAKVDSTRLLLSDRKRVYLIDLDNERILDRVNYSYLLEDEFKNLEACEYLLLAYNSSTLILQLFKIEKKLLKFAKEIDLVSILGEAGERTTKIRKLLAFKKTANFGLFVSMRLDVSLRANQAVSERLILSFEISLLDWKILRLGMIELDRINQKLGEINIIMDRRDQAYLLETDYDNIEVAVLSQNFHWNIQKRFIFKSKNDIRGRFTKIIDFL